MGRPKPENSIQHFSHPHPLFNSSLNRQDQHFSSFCCVVCKLKLKNLPSYTCKPCNFHIHLKCFELPQNIRHPFDENHLLSLIPSPKYKEGRFLCDACGKQGDGFAYHCGDCGIDLHTVCANMPSRVTHQSHPHHQLYLTFSSLPGGSSRSVEASSFRCCVCRGLGSNSWLYSCRECGGFDAHLLCTRRKLATPTNTVQHGLNRMQSQFIAPTPFVNVPSPVINYNPYDIVVTIRPMINDHHVTYTPQYPSQVSQIHDPSYPVGIIRPRTNDHVRRTPRYRSRVSHHHEMDCGELVDGSGLFSDVLEFDPSVFAEFDPSMFADFDPSMFAEFDPSMFADFDPSSFADFDPSGFADFDPSSLFDIFS